MANSSLKKQSIVGMLWSAIEKFGTTFLAFLSNLILARLLLPSDFGAIGMLHIFIAISGAFVMGGLESALIQKKEPTHDDYSTVFLWNMTLSAICYLILFLTAPAISRFYDMPILCKVLRVHGVLLFIVALSVVQSAQLRKQLRFKELSIRNLISSTSGLIVGVILAYLGYGVWSLVFSSLISNLIGSILIWKMSSWRPTLKFSITSFKELFSFGGMMLLTSLIDRIYANVEGLLIGKWYSASDMGFYNQAKKLEDVPTSTLSYIVSRVAFPVFSKLQDEKDRLLSALRRNIKAITFINFPLCVLLMIIAEPLIVLLYGSRWMAAIPYFQILCISGLLYTMNSLNSIVIISLGKGKMFFSIDVINRGVGLVLMLVGVNIGIKGLLWAVVIASYFRYFMYSIANKKLLGYGLLNQMKDVLPYLVVALLVGLVTYFLGHTLMINQYLIMVIQCAFYVSLYIGVAYLLKFEGLNIFFDVFKQYKSDKKSQR